VLIEGDARDREGMFGDAPHFETRGERRIGQRRSRVAERFAVEACDRRRAEHLSDLVAGATLRAFADAHPSRERSGGPGGRDTIGRGSTTTCKHDDKLVQDRAPARSSRAA
jgi:hypothetical protein